MDYLIERANEYGLKDIVSHYAKSNEVQGIVVGIDPWWLAAWQRRGEESLYLDYFTRRFGVPADFTSLSLMFGYVPEAELPAATAMDLDWRPSSWRGPTNHDLPPIIVTVAFKPDTDLGEFRSMDFRLPVVKQIRPLARLAGNPQAKARPIVGGVSVGCGASGCGTLGGVLEDQNGRRYGLSCYHIFGSGSAVDQPAHVDAGSSGSIGKIAHALVPEVSQKGTPCNPYLGSGVNEFDVALIDLDQSLASNFEVMDIGPVHGLMPKAQITPGLNVEMTGRTSGYRQLQIAGIAVTYKFTDGVGDEYCFKNVFEVRWPSFARLLAGRPVNGGDSGAWICAQGTTGTEWLGMIIGEDRLQGYAILGENISAELSRAGFRTRCA